MPCQKGTCSSAVSSNTGDPLQELVIFSSWPSHPGCVKPWYKCLSAHHAVPIMARCGKFNHPVWPVYSWGVKCRGHLSRKEGFEMDIPSLCGTDTAAVSLNLFHGLCLQRGRSASPFLLAGVVRYCVGMTVGGNSSYLSTVPHRKACRAWQECGVCFGLQLRFWENKNVICTKMIIFSSYNKAVGKVQSWNDYGSRRGFESML